MIQNYEIHMLQLRQVQSGELLLRGVFMQAAYDWRPEYLPVLQRKEITMSKKMKKDGETLMRGSSELAELMFDFFRKNNQYQPFTFAIVGYATETLMRFLAERSGNDYDEISKNYSNYLSSVHNDVKNANVSDLKVN